MGSDLVKRLRDGAFRIEIDATPSQAGPSEEEIREAADRIEALEREIQTLKTTQDDEALTAAWMAGFASRNDEVRALKAVAKEARWLIERTPVGKLRVAAGVADKLSALDAQKDKSHE